MGSYKRGSHWVALGRTLARIGNLQGKTVSTNDHRTKSGEISASSLSREAAWRSGLGTVSDSFGTLLTPSRHGLARYCLLRFLLPLEIQEEDWRTCVSDLCEMRNGCSDKIGSERALYIRSNDIDIDVCFLIVPVVVILILITIFIFYNTFIKNIV